MKRHRWARTRATDEGFRLRSCRDCPAVVRWRERPGRAGARAEMADDGRNWRRVYVSSSGVLGGGECRPGEKVAASPERKALARELTRLAADFHPDRHPLWIDPVVVCARLLEVRARVLEA